MSKWLSLNVGRTSAGRVAQIEVNKPANSPTLPPMNSSTSAESDTSLATILPFEPDPFEQAPFGESESELAEVIEFYVSDPGLTVA